MSLRIYAGPMEEMAPGEYQAVAVRYMTDQRTFVPSRADGHPASSWVLTIGRAADWTAADGDARLTNLFGPELDGTEDTKAALIAALHAKTLNQVGVLRATAIKARLDLLGVPYADFDGTTTMWWLFRRLLSNCLERDDRWGSAWTI